MALGGVGSRRGRGWRGVLVGRWVGFLETERGRWREREDWMCAVGYGRRR